jgi:hypothetical protein
MRVAEGMNLDPIRTTVVTVFLNGKYYGCYDLNEFQNPSWLEAHFGADSETVNIVHRNDLALAGSADDFLKLREFCRTEDFSDPENYNKLAKWIDVDSFTDYLIFQSYIANNDMFNQKYWNTSDGTIRWRPVLFDLDYGLSSAYWKKNVLAKYFQKEGVLSHDGTRTNMDIYCALRQNPEWCERFSERYVELVYSAFLPERLDPLVEELAEVYRAEMPMQFERIGTPGSPGRMDQLIKELHTFISKRPELALGFLQKEMGLSDAEMQNLINKYHKED